MNKYELTMNKYKPLNKILNLMLLSTHFNKKKLKN